MDEARTGDVSLADDDVLVGDGEGGGAVDVLMGDTGGLDDDGAADDFAGDAIAFALGAGDVASLPDEGLEGDAASPDDDWRIGELRSVSLARSARFFAVATTASASASAWSVSAATRRALMSSTRFLSIRPR